MLQSAVTFNRLRARKQLAITDQQLEVLKNRRHPGGTEGMYAIDTTPW